MSFLIELRKILLVNSSAALLSITTQRDDYDERSGHSVRISVQTLSDTEVYMIAPGQKAAMIVGANFRDLHHRLTAIF
jgi:hypothetical protein